MPWLRLRLQLCSRVVSGLEAPRPLYFSCFCMEFTSHSWSHSKCVVNNTHTHHTTPHHTTPHHTTPHHTTHTHTHTTHHTPPPPPSVLLRVTLQVALTGNFSGRCERTRWSRHEAAATTALVVATRATTIKQQANKNQTRIEQETNKKQTKKQTRSKPTNQHKQTHKQTHKHTNTQTHTHKQANNTNKHTHKQTNKQTNKQTDKQTHTQKTNNYNAARNVGTVRAWRAGKARKPHDGLARDVEGCK